MSWRMKAVFQNFVALLPSSLSHRVYYRIQRHLGGLQQVNPVGRLKAGVEIHRRVNNLQRDLGTGVFLEIGTGRRVNLPLSLWLLGAERVFTVDINPYLEEELIREDITFIQKNPKTVMDILGSRISKVRFAALLNLADREWRLADLLNLANLVYLSPADARYLPLASHTVDCCVSYTVLEHIEPDILRGILIEGNRVAKENALFIHCVDYSDHFSHSDPSISSLNFLRYSDAKWKRLAGNRYMYANRLRHDDFIELFEGANHRILEVQTKSDPSALKMIRDGELVVDDRFADKPDDVLAITSSWIVSERANNATDKDRRSSNRPSFH